MRENFDGRVTGRFPLRNGILLIKLEDDKCVDDYDQAKLLITMPSHFGIFFITQ